eukprot:35141_1
MSFLRLKSSAFNISSLQRTGRSMLPFRYFSAKATRPTPNDQNPHTANEQALLGEFAAQSLRQKDMVIVHGFSRYTDASLSYAWKQYGYDELTDVLLPSHYKSTTASPFITRMEAYLKYNKIDYAFDDSLSVILKPMHKIPWITFQGQHTADTQVVIQHVLDPAFNIDNDSHLDSAQRAVSVAFRLALDKQMYWYEMYRRYLDPDHLHHYFQSVFYQHPAADAYKGTFGSLISNQLQQQGTGRYDGDTVYLMMKELIDGIVAYIGDKPFFFGDTITSIDLVCYGHLTSAYALPFPYPFCKEHNGELPHRDFIIDYVDRVGQQCA